MAVGEALRRTFDGAPDAFLTLPWWMVDSRDLGETSRQPSFPEVPMRRVGLVIAFALGFLLPLAAEAQESASVRIGCLSVALGANPERVEAFRRGCVTSATSRIGISRSKADLPRGTSSACPSWLPSWCDSRSMCS